MKDQLRPALVAVALFTFLTGFVFPGVVTALASAAFPRRAGGSLIVENGRVIGSELIGQSFTRPEYFHSRPSAAGSGYDAASSGGTNLGPTSDKQRRSVATLTAAYRSENGLAADTPIPADAVTRSASGLDPHISPQNARLQAARVAKARRKSVQEIEALVRTRTEGPTFGLLGEARVNVLALNRALDRMR